MDSRMAKEEDAGRIMELIQQAKDFLKSRGVDQWQNGYPDAAAIRGDIRSGNGYVLTDAGRVVGYACISFDGEDSYAGLKGEWLSIQPYAVIHRMAIDNTCKGKGLATAMLRYAEELCGAKGVHSIKIDTDADNAIMKHILAKNGFAYCGLIRFDNSDKVAYEKVV